MKKRMAFLLLASMLLAAGCAKEPAPTVPTETGSTYPSFPEEKTPIEMLTQAAEKTRNAENVTVTCGRVVDGEEELFDTIPDFITNENFLTDFCAKRISATPDTEGGVKYSLVGLTRDELYALLYGEAGEDSALFGGFPGLICSIEIQVDGQGYITCVGYTVATYRGGDTPVTSETTYVWLSFGEE